MSLVGSEPPNRVVVLQFPNMDAVKAWQDEERHGHGKHRRQQVCQVPHLCRGRRGPVSRFAPRQARPIRLRLPEIVCSRKISPYEPKSSTSAARAASRVPGNVVYGRESQYCRSCSVCTTSIDTSSFSPTAMIWPLSPVRWQPMTYSGQKDAASPGVWFFQ